MDENYKALLNSYVIFLKCIWSHKNLKFNNICKHFSLLEWFANNYVVFNKFTSKHL